MKKSAMAFVVMTALCVSATAFAAPQDEQVTTAQATSISQAADAAPVPQNETELPWVEPDP